MKKDKKQKKPKKEKFITNKNKNKNQIIININSNNKKKVNSSQPKQHSNIPSIFVSTPSVPYFDIVSLFSPSKNSKTLKNPNYKTGVFLLDSYQAHNVDNIRGESIVVKNSDDVVKANLPIAEKHPYHRYLKPI